MSEDIVLVHIIYLQGVLERFQKVPHTELLVPLHVVGVSEVFKSFELQVGVLFTKFALKHCDREPE